MANPIFKRATGGILVATLVLSACADKPANLTPVAAIKPNPPPLETMRQAYRFGPGDELEVKFFFAPELNERLTVRPDGKISIMFAQDLQAAGLTADELAADIRAVLAPHVKQLDLVVIVRSFASQRAYVGGEVGKPGPVPLTGDETVLQVLAAAGWITPQGSGQIVIVRRDAAGQEQVYTVDVADLEKGVDMQQNVRVAAGDLVLVPPSDIVGADRWVDQNIRQLLPFTPSGGFEYNINTNPRTQ